VPWPPATRPVAPRPKGWFAGAVGRRRPSVVVVETVAVAAVATSVWLGVLAATRRVTWGASVGAAASLVASGVAATYGGLDGAVFFRQSWWIELVELVGLGLLAGWATRLLPAQRLVPVVVALTAAVVAVVELRQRGESSTVVNSGLLIGLGGCVGAGLLLRQSDGARAAAATQARADERLAIARELHDVVAHHVTGMVVQAQAGQLVARTDPERAAATLASIERAGSEALTSMRRVVGTLRTDNAALPIAPASTPGELDELARSSGELGLPVRLSVDATDRIPADVAQSVHRIVRESLTNARRHATGATAVDVRVARTGSSLEVLVTDDGRTSSAPLSEGYGLVGMAERVHVLGGTFDAGPRPAGGWEVRASFPCAGCGP